MVRFPYIGGGRAAPEEAKLKHKRLHALLVPAFALCMCNLPGMASTLFSDLGSTSPIYDCCQTWSVSGTGTNYTSVTAANLFTVAGTGSLAVGEIDLAVSNIEDGNTFYATIVLDNAGTPGAEVAGAYWSPLDTTQPVASCCALVSIPGITGVNLTGGQQYFMILGPLSTSDNSFDGWNVNNTGVNGDDQYSEDGGATWTDNGTSFALGAFDILGSTVPEPGSLLLLGTGLIGILGAYRRKSTR